MQPPWYCHDASDFELFGLGLENAALGLRPRGHSFSPYGPPSAGK